VVFSDLRFLQEIGGLSSGLADVLFHVFAANIGEIAEGAKPEKHKLVVEGIKFTQWRSVQTVPKQRELVFKGTGAGNECAN